MNDLTQRLREAWEPGGDIYAAADAIDRMESALEESELSHVICGVLNCTDCPGDENGADPTQAKCRKIALAIRAAAGISSSPRKE